jgi:UDP-N-acetylmuramoylalanine--D-glutamate ligase
VTGQAVARAGIADGDEVLVFDDRPGPAVEAAARDLGVTVEPTPDEAGLSRRLIGCDLVVPSPGVPVAHPVYRVAADVGVPVVSEIELAYRVLSDRDGPRLVAITGTNGKTTVTTMVTAILNEAGIRAVSAGNIGAPLIEAVRGDSDVIVAEVSSFQLQFTSRFRPRVSCWLNLAPDHLDWHPTHQHYLAAKARIWANQGEGDTAVYNASDLAVAQAAAAIPPGVDRVGFCADGSGGYATDGEYLLARDGSQIVPVAELPRAFPHDIANALAAAATATAVGADRLSIRNALVAAPMLPHRVSLVGESAGVRWYDDSKATTPASVLAAVAGFDSVVLIAGGRNKGLDLSVLRATVPKVKAVVAIGEAAAEVESAFDRLIPTERASTMASAVDAAARLARPGDVVLLSPGCASFDWYSSYGARGDNFAALVRELLEKGDTPC